MDAFWGRLLPTLKRWLYNVPISSLREVGDARVREANAPIIMVQLENEFASYGDAVNNSSDHAYLAHLKAL